LILWELHCTIELQPGEILIFPDTIVHHSNEPVTGTHHSVVAFTQQNMLDYERTQGQQDRGLFMTRLAAKTS
jgi:hypothetical protein